MQSSSELFTALLRLDELEASPTDDSRNKPLIWSIDNSDAVLIGAIPGPNPLVLQGKMTGRKGPDTKVKGHGL